MLCAAWQMLYGMLYKQVSTVWQEAQSIYKALDGNDGVVVHYWYYIHISSIIQKLLDMSLVPLRLLVPVCTTSDAGATQAAIAA